MSHDWQKHEREGWTVCSRCGLVRNYDKDIVSCRGSAPKVEQRPHVFHCSFCGKTQQQTRVLITGPGVSICDECVILCVDVLRDDPNNTGTTRPAAYCDIVEDCAEDINTLVRWAARCGDIEGVEI